MKTAPEPRRALAAGLALLVLAGAPGCRPGTDRAGERRVLIKHDMTFAEVRALIGPPSRVTRDPALLEERWIYTYWPGVAFDPASLGRVAELLVGSAILIAILAPFAMLSQGQGTFPYAGPDFGLTSGAFEVCFGPTGRVESIGPVR